MYGVSPRGLFPLSFLTLGMGPAITLTAAHIRLPPARIVCSCDVVGRIKTPCLTDGRAEQSDAVDA